MVILEVVVCGSVEFDVETTTDQVDTSVICSKVEVTCLLRCLTSLLLTFQTEPQTHLTETQTGAASMPSVTSLTMIWRGKRNILFVRHKLTMVGGVYYEARFLR